MSSRWFLQSDGESAEPVTFERLAQMLAAVGWFLWSAWHESRRFPVPAHAQTRPVPWSLPLLGPVRGFEVGLLAVDVVAVAVYAVWWLRSGKK